MASFPLFHNSLLKRKEKHDFVLFDIEMIRKMRRLERKPCSIVGADSYMSAHGVNNVLL